MKIRKTLAISGMSCPMCEKKVRQALLQVGVEQARVDYAAGQAEVTFDSRKTSLPRLAAAVEAAGYSLTTPPGKGRRFLRRAAWLAAIVAAYFLLEESGLLTRLAPGQLGRADMSYGLLFVVGLTTSVHCVTMCGGIGLSQSLPGEKKRPWRSAVVYNAARVASYALSGALLGLVGMLFGAGLKPTLSEKLQGVLKLTAGLLLGCMGLGRLDVFPFLRKIHLPFFRGHPGKKTPALVGLLNGLMPCGPLQSMQLAALATASPLKGGCAMLAFGLGTVPLMLGLGSLTAVLGRKFRRTANVLGAALVAVMGLAMLSQGSALAGLFLAPRIAPAALNAAVSSENVQTVTSVLKPNALPDISVTAGVPVRWVIQAPESAINGCNNRILIPALNLDYTFHSGENVLEFCPEEAGTLGYSCWMGMLRGSIVVTEAG